MSDNICIQINDFDSYNTNEIVDIDAILKNIEQTELDIDESLMVPKIIDYCENYTVKELMHICEYYGFAKDLKKNKFNKEQIIEFLVHFEMDNMNSEITTKRQLLWFYIRELKADPYTKKHLVFMI